MELMNNRLNSLEKALLILQKLAEEPYSFTALELSKKLNINRTTIHRDLIILKEHMYVLQCPKTKKYKLGPMCYHVGSAYLNRNHYMEEIYKIVDDVAERLKLSVGYSILDEDKIINLYENEQNSDFKMGYRAGSFYPIHCGTYGKTIMAFYEPLEKLKQIVYTTRLEKKNQNTITDPEQLLAEYERIRKQGYALSNEENTKGALGIGAPVFNKDGKITACIAAAAVKALMTEEKLKYSIRVLIEAAARISKLLP